MAGNLKDTLYGGVAVVNIPGLQGPAGKDAVVTPDMQTLHDETIAARDKVLSSVDLATATAENVKEVAVDIKASTDASVITATEMASSARDSASAASTSASAASDSASAAASSEANAATSEANAKASETAAGTSATKASASEVNVKASETAASTSATNAKASETSAASSAVSAATSATNAKASEDAAASSASAAATSATNAKGSEDAVAANATAAQESATTASGYVSTAKAWAVQMDTPVEDGLYGAKYYAEQAMGGQIPSDWAETDTTAKSYIKNKPALATVATSGSYNDLTDTPTIPEAITVDSEASATSTNPLQNKVIYAGIMELAVGLSNEIKKKADTSSLAAVATSGSYTDLTDTPTIPAEVTVDSALSATSTNPVQNKAIYDFLARFTAGVDPILDAKLDTSELTTALTELITEYGGTVPS